jgi:hypothetical protein
MGFLDNSGDIILDAVLTDTGRMRLARGDGSFKIVKFALGDDEINYELYNKNHASGSAYYDLEILQLPVLEAFTDNAASMKSKLISIPRNNLLYLPILKLNEVFDTSSKKHTDGVFYIAANETSENDLANGGTDATTPLAGILYGERPDTGGNKIRVDQGLDTTAISPGRTLDPLLAETDYLIEIDDRLGQIVAQDGTRASVSFVDDDSIASYYLSLGTDRDFVQSNEDTTTASTQTVAGPRGSVLAFKVQSSLELNTSTYLFTTIGTTRSITGTGGASNYYTIDSTIRVVGVNTGYRLDIPVRFCRKV